METEQDLAGFQLEVVDEPRRRKDTFISIHRLWMNVHTMFGLCEETWWAEWKQQSQIDQSINQSINRSMLHYQWLL